MYRCHDAATLAKLLRTSLIEVVSAADVSEGRPIKVSPRSIQQVQSILRICCFHRVAWMFESGLKLIEDGQAPDVDIVLSLTFLMESSDLQHLALVHEGGDAHIRTSPDANDITQPRRLVAPPFASERRVSPAARRRS
jgi:FAD/FMN-containing dehydrogenases